MKDLIGTNFETAARVVFGCLCDHANAKSEMWPPWVSRSEEGYAAWPSIKRIVAVTAVSERGVQTALRELERRGAIRCIYRSLGGAPQSKGGKLLPAHTSCYLITPQSLHRSSAELATESTVDDSITPQSLHRSRAISSETEPRSQNPITPQPKCDNPAVSGINNPAVTAPEVFNHHHQKERSKRNTKSENPTPSFPSISDDDDGARKRAPIDNPEREFRRRLQEGAWREGPISDVDSIVFFVSDELRYEEEIYREFLDYEEAQTTPAKIKTPAAHYRALLKKFRGSRAHRLMNAQKEKLRERQQRTTVPPPVCPLAKCNGSGEIYRDPGHLPDLCDCEAGRALAAKCPELLPQLKRMQGAR